MKRTGKLQKRGYIGSGFKVFKAMDTTNNDGVI